MIKTIATILAVCYCFLVISSNQNMGAVTAKKQEMSRQFHFNSILDCIETSGRVVIHEKKSVYNITTHSFFKKLVKWDTLFRYENLYPLPKGQYYAVEFNCKNSPQKEVFNILYFDKLDDAKREFKRLEGLVNGDSIFEKPFKQFFRKKNMIFFITMKYWNDSNPDRCSFDVIEYLSKELYNYEVDFSDRLYHSRRERNPLTIP